MAVQPTDQCDQGSCPAFVPVSIQTPAGPVGCAHHYDTNFAALIMRGCDHARHIGDLKPPRWIGTHHQQEPRNDPDHQAREGYPEAALGLFAEDAPGRKRIMRRLTYLAAAAAATGALALIPLATLASSASAATTPPPKQAGSHITLGNWSGYMLTATKKNRFSYVYSDFTVPSVSRSEVLRSSKTGPYDSAAFWVGFGGDGAQLEQGGVIAQSAKAGQPPTYFAFSEVVPQEPGPIPMKLNIGMDSGVVGSPITIHAGDSMSAEVADYYYDPSNKVTYPYVVFVNDWTQGKYGMRVVKYARGSDKTAEVITEATGNGPSDNLAGFFNTGTVKYTSCYASVGGSPGLSLADSQSWGLSPEPMWTTTAITLGNITLAAGSGKTHYYKTIEVPSALSVPGAWNPQGGGGLGFTAFSTKWDLTS